MVQIRYLPTFNLRTNLEQIFCTAAGGKSALSLHHKKGMFKYYDRYLEIASRLCTDFVAKDKFDKSRTQRFQPLLKENGEYFLAPKALARAPKAQFRRRTFHEPNLIQIKAGPNHENPAF